MSKLIASLVPLLTWSLNIWITIEIQSGPFDFWANDLVTILITNPFADLRFSFADCLQFVNGSFCYFCFCVVRNLNWKVLWCDFVLFYDNTFCRRLMRAILRYQCCCEFAEIDYDSVGRHFLIHISYFLYLIRFVYLCAFIFAHMKNSHLKNICQNSKFHLCSKQNCSSVFKQTQAHLHKKKTFMFLSWSDTFCSNLGTIQEFYYNKFWYSLHYNHINQFTQTQLYIITSTLPLTR